jgi:hypothetical protein
MPRLASCLREPGRHVVTDDIVVHFNRMGQGGTLVVVAVGADVYGASALEPVAALRSAATKAADDLALRGHAVDAKAIVAHGMRSLPSSS